MEIPQTTSSEQIEQCMLTSWQQVAEKHAAASSGAIGVLDVDPKKYPEQALNMYHIEGDSQPPAGLAVAASFVVPRFEAISQEFYDDPESSTSLNRAGEILDAGQSVIVATNHTELIDVAIAQAAVSSYLKTKGHEFATSLLISKMISLLASNELKEEDGSPMSAGVALKILCDDVYMSYPKTETTSKTEIAQSMPGVVKEHNIAVRKAISKKLGEGGVLLAMCPSGTTDKLEPGGDTCILQPVQPGTAQLMSQEGTYVLPIAAHFGDKPFIKASDMPKQLTSPEESHAVMQSIARTLQQNVPGTNFQYAK